MSIITLSPKIELSNVQGEINIDATSGLKENLLQYEKVKWEKWCLIHDRDEKGTRIIEVENTSFTGEGGCELKWTLQVNPNAEMELKQASGKISGKGEIFDLKIKQASGSISWEKSNMPMHIELAAGKIEIDADGWPKNQKSSIEVAAGSVKIESPKKATVTTLIDSAIASEENDFSTEDKDNHLLSIKVATGSIKHKAK